MKDIICTILISIFTFSAIAQETPSFTEKKNVNKINILTGPIYKFAHVSYEKPIGKRFSINTTVKARPMLGLKKGFSSVSYSGTTYNPFTDAKFGGAGNITEFRIYGKKKGPLKGFYFGPYTSAMFYKFQTGTIPATFHDKNGVEYKGDVKETIKLNFIGGGLQMGAQWLIKDMFVIDWNILGIGFASAKLTGGIEATNTSANFDFRNYEDDLDSVTLGLDKFLPIKKSLEKESVSLSLRAFSPIFKTGLFIGLAY